jgi:hypothetical protein
VARKDNGPRGSLSREGRQRSEGHRSHTNKELLDSSISKPEYFLDEERQS